MKRDVGNGPIEGCGIFEEKNSGIMIIIKTM